MCIDFSIRKGVYGYERRKNEDDFNGKRFM